ncbi:MAG: DedA family protein [Deltaproteobacteria bacterium]|jgi:membrane protein YqaA with SNARE-associated domain|nr:DedA family protein [Deltaproteobacteria bacterium]MBW2518741.1 DedA family protein [Deltaproteobacteria bacterium]
MTKLMRRLYDWVLHWASTPYGGPALFILAFAESSVFPIPPDVLLIALCVALPTRAWKFAFIASFGSVLGGMFGYGIGWGFWALVSEYFFKYIPGFTPDIFAKVQSLFAQYDFWVVFTAGFTPIPYKVITLGAGVFQINFIIFFIASMVSRSLRFFLVAWLLYKYGAGVRSFIDKYFNLLSITFLVLLIGGFMFIKYVL